MTSVKSYEEIVEGTAYLRKKQRLANQNQEHLQTCDVILTVDL